MRVLNFLKDYYKNNSVILLLSVGFLLLAVFIFFQIIDEIVLEKESGFDDFVFAVFSRFIVKQNLNQSAVSITNFSSPKYIMYFLPLTVLLLYLFKQKKKALFLSVTSAGGILLFTIFKLVFERKRPPYPLLYPENGYSFPSGHATFSFILYGALAYLVWLTDLPKYLKVVMMLFLVVLSVVIGISRIYLRVHYPSDVLGGFCLGYSWLLIMIYSYRRWWPLG